MAYYEDELNYTEKKAEFHPEQDQQTTIASSCFHASIGRTEPVGVPLGAALRPD